MKLYRQGKSEIRIHLTNADLKDFAITVEELDYDSPRGKRAIRSLFEKAKKELGFETEGEKLYIQLYPTSGGACDLFITKLQNEKKAVCFRFSDFNSFFDAISRTPSEIPVDLWQEKEGERFYALTKESEAPPLFGEFGERVKLPSPVFLKSRCRKIRRVERK